MKAILVIDNISTDLNIEELRADIKVNCYGEVMAIYNNVSLKPMPQKEDLNEKLEIRCSDDELDIRVAQARGYQFGWNGCLKEILGEEE